MSFRQLIVSISFSLIFIGCSKNSLNYEEVPEEILFSCVDYSRVTDPNFDSDDLYAFWDIFVADAKCSMSSNPDDIMHPSSPFASSYNGFIESKNRFFEKKFDGLRYLDCSWYEDYSGGTNKPNLPHTFHDCSKDNN